MPSAGETFLHRAKSPSEVIVVEFDFTRELETDSDQIAAQFVSAATYSGNDLSPAAILDGPASVSGDLRKVLQAVQAGLEGTIYMLVCEITTATGLTLRKICRLPVLPEAA